MAVPRRDPEKDSVLVVVLLDLAQAGHHDAVAVVGDLVLVEAPDDGAGDGQLGCVRA